MNSLSSNVIHNQILHSPELACLLFRSENLRECEKRLRTEFVTSFALTWSHTSFSPPSHVARITLSPRIRTLAITPVAPIPVAAGLPVEEGGIVLGDTVGATVLEVGEGGISRSVKIIPVKVDILFYSAICVENGIIIKEYLNYSAATMQ